LGNTLKELGRLVEAELSYKQSIALKPDFNDAHYNLGVMLHELGRLDEAEASYTQAIALKPDYAQAHSNLGDTLKELGRLEEAESSYIQAIVLKPDYAEAHSNLANTLKELGRLEEAESSYKQAIALKTDFNDAHYNLGVMLHELGRLDEAEASYTQAIALKPDFAEAYCNLGGTLKELGRLDEAEASYTQALALKSDYAEAHYNLGVALQVLGRIDEAEASYKQAIALKPDFGEATHMLAALTGEKTATAPRDYVEGLFDNYAAKFESSLVDNLEYKIPRVIAEMIIKDSKFDCLGSIVDLGCGTGLFGMEIKQFCEHLEGVDLSEKMLDKATGKNVYNKLIKQDIVDYLSKERLNFDYFISTDVFVYIGDLSDVFRLIKSRNKTGGKFAFSTEVYDGDGFFLEQSGRYSHSKKYIDGLCEKFGYKLRHFETQPLRKDKNQYISGGLYLLDF
jgi:predicted TPR repeat methyltransferase